MAEEMHSIKIKQSKMDITKMDAFSVYRHGKPFKDSRGSNLVHKHHLLCVLHFPSIYTTIGVDSTWSLKF